MKFWSFGPDLFFHFQLIFKRSGVLLHQKHKQISLKPDDEEPYRCPAGTKKISSIWNHSHQLYFKGLKSNGSNRQSFEALGNAVALMNEENKMRQQAWLTWQAFGLKDGENLVTLDVPEESGFVSSRKPNSFEDAIKTISKGLAFIVPDEKEDTFNFLALTAIWKGIPTLLSSRSSVGKMASDAFYSHF